MAKELWIFLARLGIDSLAFGTEEVLDYQKIADLYTEQGTEMEKFVENLPDSLSYPQKTQAMWKEFAGLDFSGNTPNHVLALAMPRRLRDVESNVHPIQRQGAGYHLWDKDVDFARNSSPSASIRPRFLRTLYMSFCCPL